MRFFFKPYIEIAMVLSPILNIYFFITNPRKDKYKWPIGGAIVALYTIFYVLLLIEASFHLEFILNYVLGLLALPVIFLSPLINIYFIGRRLKTNTQRKLSLLIGIVLYGILLFAVWAMVLPADY